MRYNDTMTDVARIETKSLSKRYNKTDGYALRNLTIRIEPGEVYGFLGPNGAGKSTTIRTMMGFLRPTDGTVSILGRDVTTDGVEVRRHVGYVSGDMELYGKLTGAQYLEYMRDLYQVKDRSYYHKLIERLQPTLNKPLGNLSRGNHQKIALIQAFMNQPQVLILDEPTSGLDPLMQDVFYDLVAECKARGDSVFMSSHIMSEVQKVCDRFGVIRAGKLITEQSIDELHKRAAQTFDVTFRDKPPLSELKAIKGLKIVSHDKQSVTFHMSGELSALFACLARHDVAQLDTHELDIDELFRHYYTDTKEKRS